MSLKGENVLLILEEGQEKLGLAPALTGAKANVFVAKNMTKAIWYVDGAHFTLIAICTKGKRDAPLDYARAIRANKRSAATPIAIVCDPPDSDFVQKAAALGVTTIVSPPLESKDLIDKLSAAVKPPKKTPSFDVRLINCFIEAIKEVMLFYLGDGTAIGKAGIKPEQALGDYVTALIAFNGQGQMGSMALAFDQPSIGVMAKKVFAQPDAKLDDAGAADLAGELCNQVLGKTKANFLKIGLSMQIGLPEVVIGAGHQVYHKVKSPVLQVAVTHPEATCKMEFCVATGTEEAIDAKATKATASGVMLFD